MTIGNLKISVRELSDIYTFLIKEIKVKTSDRFIMI